jgi:DNA-binding IclR family transcriptional regulator
MRKGQGTTPSAETVTKTLALLDLFKQGRPEKTATEIARAAQLPLSTAFRLINTLVRLRFVDYAEQTKTYRLGLKLLELGHIVSQQLDLPHLALPILTRLSDATGETTHLSIRDGDEGVFIAKVDAVHTVRMHTPLGRRVPLHAGASMKVLLAGMTDDLIDDYIQRRLHVAETEYPPVDPNVIRAQIAKIRAQGFGVSASEQTQGAAGVGAPVRNHLGEVVAGLTISGPEQRFTPEQISIFAERVVNAAHELSRSLGYQA